jgi:hypothetical protein
LKKTLDFLKFICYDIDTIKKTGTLMKVGDKVRIYDNNPHTDCCYGVAVILKIEKKDNARVFRVLHKEQEFNFSEPHWRLEKWTSEPAI